MSTGLTDDELDHLLDAASDPQPPPDFEESVVRRLQHLREDEKARDKEAALNRLLRRASRPPLPGGFEQRVMARLSLDSTRRPIVRRLADTACRYHLPSWGRAACLLVATALACLLIGRPEHAETPRQTAAAHSLTLSAEKAMALGRDSLLAEAFNSLNDAEVVAALCAVSTDSSEGNTALQRRDSPLNTSH